MHWSSEKTKWDRKNNRVELVNRAIVRQPGETITADYMILDLNNRTLDARGNCVYIASEAIIHSEQMHFNLDTRTGTILGGRISNEQFTLTGERINKLSSTRFQTHQGAYSTCRDCPQSWTLFAGDVDMEIEGYAFMNDVTGKVKDAPLFWTPYLVIPLKTKRQSGFLFPKMGVSIDGFNFVQPFFWATSPSTDMTFSLGRYGGRGWRGEWEGRYKLSNYSDGQANFYYLEDSKFEESLIQDRKNNGVDFPITDKRWAFNLKQKHDFPYGVNEKLKFTEVRDNRYPSLFKDVGGTSDAVLTSDLVFDHATNQVSSYVLLRRTRNLLEPDPFKFDQTTVQIFPQVFLTTNDKMFFDSQLGAGITFGLTNFTRAAGTFDRDRFAPPPDNYLQAYDLGRDPIRKGTRLSFIPRVYTTLRPFDVVSVVPQIEFRNQYYQFPDQIPSLTRGYVLGSVDLSTQLEKIYDVDDVKYPRLKHLIRPLLTYSVIPFSFEDFKGKGKEKGGVQVPHPFLGQMEYAGRNGFSGYNFDNYDLIPKDTSTTYNNYFTPIGHSLTYGYSTQLIRRNGSLESTSASYNRLVELRGGQTFNLRELRLPEKDQKPFSKVFQELQLAFDQWSGSALYEYYPHYPINGDKEIGRHSISLGGGYRFEKALHQRILDFERSFNMGYTYRNVDKAQAHSVSGGLVYSVSDYVTPTFSATRSFAFRNNEKNPTYWPSVAGGMRFQSPAQCWQASINASRGPCPDKECPGKGYKWDLTFDLSLNLTGSGFGGFSDAVGTATGGASRQ